MLQKKKIFQHLRPYLFAFLYTGIAVSLQLVLRPFVEQIAFILLYPAIVIAAYLLPLYASYFSLLLSSLAFVFIFSMFRTHGYLDHAEVLRLTMFIASGITICYLISRGNQINENLKATLRRLKNIEYAIDSSSIVAITDRQGVIKYVNDQFCQISKYSEHELLGKTHRIINSGYHDKSFFIELWKTIVSGNVWKGEILNRAKDGSFYWVDTVITPLLDEKGKPYEYIAIRNDITHRKRTEENLKSAIQTRDQFLSIASHELKTPLTTLKLKFQMFERQIERKNPEYETEESVLKLITDGLKQTDNIERLVNDMLDISRINTGKLNFNMNKADLCKLVHQVVDNCNLLLEKFQTEISVDYCETIIGNWDQQRIEQVVLNLITNAARYGNKKPIHIKIGRDENWAYVSIKDQGIGIDKKDQERIFQKFERAIDHNEVSGLGLGLYISKKIVDAHEGKIKLESEKGKGSTFTVYLPFNPNLQRPLPSIQI